MRYFPKLLRNMRLNTVREKGDCLMKTPIIPIPRASESTIQALINAGILEISEDGIKVTENRKVLPPASKQD